jgi:hypothetical protein
MTSAPTRSTRGRVIGRLKLAIDAMVWDGLTRSAAAVAAGMLDHSVREALRKPHVKFYLRQQMEALRTAARAKNISRLVAIRDSSGNAMAQLGAIKMLEEGADLAAPGRVPHRPGIVIVVVKEPERAQSQPITIDVPLVPGPDE